MTDPLALAEAKLHWLDRRQRVLAQNVANADTPRYQARDLQPFAALLAQAGGPVLARTAAAHLAPAGGGGSRDKRDRRQAEVSPDGNAVSLDQQALKIADTDQQHQLAITIYRRFTAMFQTALGKP